MNKPTFDDEFEDQLKKLAVSAQQHPSLTQGRQFALRLLVNRLLQSNRLCRPQQGRF